MITRDDDHAEELAATKRGDFLSERDQDHLSRLADARADRVADMQQESADRRWRHE